MICRPGYNSWRCTKAGKVSFIIDAAEYFEAIVYAVRQARQTIYIAGWDFDSRLNLNRRGRIPHHVPPLGRLINQAAKRNKSLQIYILTWDFPFLFMRERQLLPVINVGWRMHRRVHFHLDDEHPFGGSQHQKFVVIDDHIAFCGGLDLTNNRWDTPEHRPEDARRNSGKAPYRPFHDVQVAVSGQTARLLGVMFRKRWRCATGMTLTAPAPEPGAQWPDNLAVHITDGQVAVARTLPSFKTQPAVQEVERIYLDAIRSAAKWIYIENQYLTAESICKALGRRLEEEQGPEIVIVMPAKADGWLEQSTMDAIRRRNLQKLAQQDHGNRLAVYYPVVGGKAVPVYVHAKIMVADDRLAIVGSANLSNRSMGLDSECCLAVEGAAGSPAAVAIDQFRQRLLCEHLSVDAAELMAACAKEGSLIRAIETLNQPHRGLRRLDISAEPILDGTAWGVDHSYLDPEKPFMFDLMIDHFNRDDSSGSAMAEMVKAAILLAGLFAVAAAWHWAHLGDWITVRQLVQWADMLDNLSIMIPVVVGSYIVAGFLFVPITVLIGATALVLPPWPSFFCALGGSLTSAVISYWVGRGLGQAAVQRLAGKRLGRLNRYLSRQGVLAMIMVRNLPLAPFTVINFFAGTTHIKFSHYVLGTVLGMAPGILAITFFTNGLMQFFRNPRWVSFLLVTAMAGLIGIVFWRMRKRLKTRQIS